MNKIFLHIGLGKCASSKLQKDIFPQIAKFIDYDYTGNENIAENEMIFITNPTQLSYELSIVDRRLRGLNLNRILLSVMKVYRYDSLNIIEFAQKI